MLFSELKEKDVISIRDCRKLGRIKDLELDACTGQIHKVIIPGHGKFNGFFCADPEYVICYKDIKQIGPDIILVDV